MDSALSHSDGHFQTTLWNVVLEAGRSENTLAREAMERLCQGYWYPLYAFVRRQGYQVSDAQDLTQAFFLRLLDKHTLQQVDPSRGKFRTFLLASLKNFLANEWDKGQAWKRGGREKVVSLDEETAESRYRREPDHDMSPERIFERRWALEVLERVLERLRGEFSDLKGNLFEQLKETLTGDASSRYSEIANRLGMTEGAVKVAAHRFRQRYRELARIEVAQTLGPDENVDDELRYLLNALGKSS